MCYVLSCKNVSFFELYECVIFNALRMYDT